MRYAPFCCCHCFILTIFSNNRSNIKKKIMHVGGLLGLPSISVVLG